MLSPHLHVQPDDNKPSCGKFPQIVAYVVIVANLKMFSERV